MRCSKSSSDLKVSELHQYISKCNFPSLYNNSMVHISVPSKLSNDLQDQIHKQSVALNGQ